MGTEAVPGTAVCAGGNERDPKHPGKYQPGIGSTVRYTALQLPIQGLQEEPEEMKRFGRLGYRFDPGRSETERYVFIRGREED